MFAQSQAGRSREDTHSSGKVSQVRLIAPDKIEAKLAERLLKQKVSHAEISLKGDVTVSEMPIRSINPVAKNDRRDPSSLFATTIIRADLFEHVNRMKELAKKKTVVTKPEINLAGVDWSVEGENATGEIYLLADTIRISGESSISLSSPQIDRGGTLVLFARRVIREPSSILHFDAMGGLRDDFSGHPAGEGGRLIVACEEYIDGDTTSGIDKLVFKVRNMRVEGGKLQYEGTGERSSPIYANVLANQFRGDSQSNRDGVIRIVKDLNNNGETRVVPNEFVALWQIRMWEYLEANVLDAVRRNNRKEITNLFRRFEKMPSYPVPTEDDAKKAYRETLKRLTDLRKELTPPLSASTVSIEGQDGRPEDVTIFVDSSQSRILAAPTDALIQARLEGQRSVIGLLEFDRDHPEKAILTLDLRLSLDPWLRARLEAGLAKNGDTLWGVFKRWDLTARRPLPHGLKEVEVGVAGEVIQLSMTLDTRIATAILWRLASEGGLPLGFDWKTTSEPKLEGEPITLNISLTRRASHSLVIKQGSLTNGSRHTTSVSYIQLGTNRFARPRASGSIVIGAGSSVSLREAFGLPTDINLDDASIPPEAVSVAVHSWDEDFQRDPGLAETVAVRNLLPSHDTARQTDLRFVEVKVVQVVGEGGEAVESAAGPFRLAPRGADGAEVAVPFLKPGTNLRKYRLEGVAYYQGGSKDDLKPTTFEGTSVDVTDTLLPGP